jgi:D-methionine transport system ATP-binding protein
MRVDGISKAFGSHVVLSNVSLGVPKGSIHGIIGKSGAGKTTLIRIAGLLEKPDSGSVRYEGIETPVHLLRGRALLEARRKTGFVFQSCNLFAARTAGENIAFPLEAAGWPHAKAHARVAELLALVGLSDKADSPSMHLSGGEKQRIAIARALANHPSILFSDEATSALDPETTRSILELIRSLREMLGLTVIMVTHQMEVVRRICDTVSVIEGGKIVEQGLVADVFTNPRSDAAKAFLKEDRND